jgi:hypothetical protein
MDIGCDHVGFYFVTIYSGPSVRVIDLVTQRKTGLPSCPSIASAMTNQSAACVNLPPFSPNSGRIASDITAIE